MKDKGGKNMKKIMLIIILLNSACLHTAFGNSGGQKRQQCFNSPFMGFASSMPCESLCGLGNVKSDTPQQTCWQALDGSQKCAQNAHDCDCIKQAKWCY